MVPKRIHVLHATDILKIIRRAGLTLKNVQVQTRILILTVIFWGTDPENSLNYHVN